MKNFIVYESANESSLDLYERSAGFVFVRSEFSWLALIAPVVWALFHRAWLVLIGYLIVIFGLEFAMHGVGVGEMARALVGLMVNLLMALEADQLRRWTLERKGFREVGTVIGPSQEACELQFLQSWGESLDGQPA